MMKKLFRPNFLQVIISVGTGFILFLVLASSCGHGFPDGSPDFPCDTDYIRNIVIFLIGCFFLIYPIAYLLTSLAKTNILKLINNTKKTVMELFIVGCISGLLSFYTIYLAPVAVYFSPGLIFGFIIGIYFFTHKHIQSLPRLFSFIFISTLAYFLAYFVGVFMGMIFAIGNISALLVVPLISGGIGSLVLLRGFHAFIAPFTANQIKKLVILGSILSLTMHIIPNGLLFDQNAHVESFPGLPYNWLFSLFIFWQIVMTIAIGLTTFSNEDKERKGKP